MSQYKQISATDQVKVGAAKLKSIFVSAASSTPTITVYDTLDGDTSNDPKVLDTFTPVAATNYQFTGDDGGLFLKNGLYVVISGTVSCTVAYE